MMKKRRRVKKKKMWSVSNVTLHSEMMGQVAEDFIDGME